MRLGFFFLFLVVLLLIVPAFAQEVQESALGRQRIDFFYIEGCVHCAEQDAWNREFSQETNARFVYHDVGEPAEAQALDVLLKSRGLPSGLPVTVMGDVVLVGFDERVKEKIRAQAFGEQDDGGRVSQKYPLWLLAVSLGFLDGVNPCALWVLVFLIGLLVGVRDKARLWIFGGTFLLASGVLYFLFMTAWLNVFLLVGAVRVVQVAVGVGAFVFGVLQLREFIMTKGALVCKVKAGKERVVQKIELLVRAPLTWGVLGGVVALAFSVNVIEFLCSSALPVVFTQALVLQALPAWQYYAYVVLYDVFFMLDDAVVFLLALWAIPYFGERYAGWCRLMSAVILIVFALLLLFWPSALM